jgi:quercetin dioxygenase-like cupin family protein
MSTLKGESHPGSTPTPTPAPDRKLTLVVPPAGPDSHVKQDLLERVADADTPRHVTFAPEDGVWQDFIGPGSGVQIRVLHRGQGRMSYLLRMAVGSTLPAHRHSDDEVCYVVNGRLRVGKAWWIPPGGFHFARRGDLHASITAETDALIFMHGAWPSPADVLR